MKSVNFIIFIGLAILLACSSNINNEPDELNIVVEKTEKEYLEKEPVFINQVDTNKKDVAKKSVVSDKDKSAEQFFNSLKVVSQNFTINVESDTMIFGEHGTVIYFPKEVFSGYESVDISLKEYYSKYDIFNADMTTYSNDRVLETYGMIDVQAYSNGKKIELDTGKSMVVHFPVKVKKNNRAKLFYGKRTNDKVNWEVGGEGTVNRFSCRIGVNFDGKYLEKNNDGRKTSSFPECSLLDYFSEFTLSKKDSIKLESLLLREVSYKFYINESGYIENIVLNQGLDKEIDLKVLSYLKKFHKSKYGMKFKVKYRKSSIWLDFGRKNKGIKSRKEYREQFERKYKEFENVKDVNEAELNYYIFSANKLGLINCDDFIGLPKEKIDMISDIDSKTKTMLVFKDRNSYLKPDLIDKKAVFKNIPKGIEATIIALKYNYGTPLLCEKEIITSVDALSNMEYRAVNLKELKELIN